MIRRFPLLLSKIRYIFQLRHLYDLYPSVLEIKDINSFLVIFKTTSLYILKNCNIIKNLMNKSSYLRV